LASCARLALFALAVQLVAAFGHFHKDDLLPAVTAGLPAAQSSSRGADSPAPPADHSDSCTICASIAMAGSLVVPEPPAVIVPPAPRETLLPARTVVLAAGDAGFGFRARAPPA